MAHPFGDDGERNAFGAGGGGPAVACYVERQGNGDAGHRGDAFEVVVDVVAHVAVGAPFVCSGVADDGEQVAAAVLGVFVEYLLHLFCPSDDELLACLAPAVGDVPVFEIRLFQISHVNEAHAAQVEAHHKHIAGIVKCRSQRQVQCLNFFDDSKGKRTFDSLVNAGIDMTKRIAVLDDVVLDRTVIDGPQDAGIEGDGVGRDTPAFKPCLIAFHGFGGDAVEHYVFLLSEFLEAVERGSIGLGSARLAVLFQFGDSALHEVEEGVFMRITVEFVDHVVGGVSQPVGIEPSADLQEALDIPADAFANR